MDITSLIGPWLSLLLVLGPLFVAERWIHQHSYGVGYLLTGDKGAATGFYYLVFFPGVFLHEFTQYLVAGILNVPLKKLEPRLQEQDSGTLRYDFVTIDTKKTDTLKASIIGGVPFILAGFLVYYISTAILDLHILLEALGTYDLPTITSALQAQFNTPDFWFWLYILFAISNGMIPTKEDRAGWGLIVVVIGVISIAFLVIGLDDVLVETLDGPVREGLQTVTTILSIILVLDFTAILILGITEDTLERMRGFKTVSYTHL
ncbi:MAG: hypothetical protein GYB66_09975, partial [Chloroflexi bacterium]|nr:hypothetical protein [Chloroflexota bacterium]